MWHSLIKYFLFFILTCGLMLLPIACGTGAQDEAKSNHSSLQVITNPIDPEAGFPQPDPYPKVMKILIQGAPITIEKPVLIVGLPGCAEASSKILITKGAETKTLSVTAEGSFATIIQAKADEKLAIQYQGEGFEPQYLVVPPRVQGSGLTSLQLVPLPDLPLIQRTSPEQVSIQGKVLYTPVVTLLGINVVTGHITKVVINQDGYFQMNLPALPGEQIRLAIEEMVLENVWGLQAP